LGTDWFEKIEINNRKIRRRRKIMARKVKQVIHQKFPYGQIYAYHETGDIYLREIGCGERREVELDLDEARSLFTLLPKLIEEAEAWEKKVDDEE
jgi:hypothetical protein